MPSDPDIICAPATPEGVAALAVVRLSGAGSCSMVEELLGLPGGRLGGMRRKVALLRDGDRTVDRVVALSWPPGGSYTGEEMVEILCHGIPAIVAAILDLLQARGARLAAPGEFTRRALASGTLTALDVLALAGRLRGENEGEELAGRLREGCGRLLEATRGCRDLLEGDLEFGESNPDAGARDAAGAVEALRLAAESIRTQAGRLDGTPRVILMGPVNSGKSTLFNLLTGADVLVSPEPGTTREGASREVLIRGRRLLLCDSAGTGGEGLDRIASAATAASIGPYDCVVWMSESGGEPVPEGIRAAAWEVVEVASKSDRTCGGGGGHALRISSRSGEGVETLGARITAAQGSTSLSGLGESVVRAVAQAQDALRERDLPLAAVHLQEIEDSLVRILGEGNPMTLSIERALDRLCVGK